MTDGASPPPSLARPVAALGVVATLVVVFHGDGHDPTPALPMALLVLAACCLRTRATRVLFFVPACLFIFAFFSSFARVSTSDRSVYRTLLYVRLLEGAFFALLLAPLMISSLRGGRAGRGTILDGSHRRSPWAVAAGTAALFGELSSGYYCGWVLVPDRGAPFRHSQWEQGVLLLYGLAAACALWFVVADFGALSRLLRVARWTRDGHAPPTDGGARSDVGMGEEARRLSPANSDVPAASELSVCGSPRRALRSLTVSIVIDLVALGVAVAVTCRRIIAPPE
ncbi:MAG: hypothetical protein M3O50_17230 [Myxococcota bacterium]|nr:hypothetical protein [Myxococcota bacterium]